jgi:hypothetical protein
VIGIRHLPWADRPWHRYEVGMLSPDLESDPEYAVMWAGESVESVRDLKPAAEIVRDLPRESEEALARSYSVTTNSNEPHATSAKIAS